MAILKMEKLQMFFFLRKTLVLACIFFAVASPSALSANSQQKLWPSDSQVFTRIQNLYRINNLATPSTAGPWTTNELKHMVDHALLSMKDGQGDSGALVSAIMLQLGGTPRLVVAQELSLDYAFDYSFETYLHTNTTDFTQNADWYYGWDKRAPILQIPLEFTALDKFSGHLDLSVMFRIQDDLSPPVGLYSSAFRTNHSLTDFYQLDLNWPYRAAGVFGADHWSFQYGRDKLSWGPGHTGNFMLSANMPYHEHLLFKTHFDSFSFLTTCIFFPSPKEMGTGLANLKSFIGHRIEFNITKDIRFSLSESIMYQDEVFDLRFLNPLMIYHQYFTPAKTNSILTAEIQAALLPGLAVYGQFGVDEFKFLGESSEIPNALAWQLGLEYLRMTKVGTFLLWGEYVHTDPMFYQRNLVDYIVSYKSLYEYLKSYLGYPSGGDSRVLAFGAEWDSLTNITATLLVKYLEKGESRFNVAYPPADPTASTPTGIVEHVLTVSLYGFYNLTLPESIAVGKKLAFYGGLTYIGVKNKNNSTLGPVHDAQCVFGIAYSM